MKDPGILMIIHIIMVGDITVISAEYWWLRSAVKANSHYDGLNNYYSDDLGIGCFVECNFVSVPTYSELIYGGRMVVSIMLLS